MIFTYGCAKDNGCEAAWLYKIFLPGRREPSRPNFAAVLLPIDETGSVATHTIVISLWRFDLGLYF